MNEAIHDGEQVATVEVARIEAERLAKENGRRFELVAAEAELAEEPVGGGAAELALDALAEIALGLAVAAQGEEGAGAEQSQLDAAGVILEGPGGDGDDTGEVPSAQELLSGLDEGIARHAPGVSKRPARKRGAVSRGNMPAA